MKIRKLKPQLRRTTSVCLPKHVRHCPKIDKYTKIDLFPQLGLVRDMRSPSALHLLVVVAAVAVTTTTTTAAAAAAVVVVATTTTTTTTAVSLELSACRIT